MLHLGVMPGKRGEVSKKVRRQVVGGRYLPSRRRLSLMNSAMRSAKDLLRVKLDFTARKHQVPGTVDLVFELFGVGDEGFLVVPGSVALFLGVLFVSATVADNFHEPDALLLLWQLSLNAIPPI